MVRKSKGKRRGTRRKLKRGVRDKFKVTPYLQEFRIGEKVVINLNPSSHRGFPDPVFQGRVGEVIEKRGRAYVIEVKVGDKTKKIIAAPEHLTAKVK